MSLMFNTGILKCHSIFTTNEVNASHMHKLILIITFFPKYGESSLSKNVDIFNIRIIYLNVSVKLLIPVELQHHYVIVLFFHFFYNSFFYSF